MLSKLYRSMSVGYTIHNTGIVASWDRVRLRLHQRFVDWNIAISTAVERECQTVNLQRQRFVTRLDITNMRDQYLAIYGEMLRAV